MIIMSGEVLNRKLDLLKKLNFPLLGLSQFFSFLPLRSLFGAIPPPTTTPPLSTTVAPTLTTTTTKAAKTPTPPPPP